MPSVQGKVKALLDLCGCVCPLLSPQPGGWGQGSAGRALPPRAVPRRAQPRDCKPKVEDYSLTEKRKRSFFLTLDSPFT